MLDSHFFAAHEPIWEQWLQATLAWRKGSLTRAEFEQAAVCLDRWRPHEAIASHWFYPAVPALARRYPSAKFILLIRDPRRWMNSMINDILHVRTRPFPEAAALEGCYDLFFGPKPDQVVPEEQVLADEGLHSVDGYLAHWAQCANTVLNGVPRDRLLVLRTEELSQNASSLAAFLDVDASLISVENSQVDHRQNYRRLTDELPQDYLQAKIDAHVGQLACPVRSRDPFVLDL